MYVGTRAIKNPTMMPCKNLRMKIATICSIWIVPSMISESKQSMRSSFLNKKIYYLLLINGIMKIDKNEPNMAPIVKAPIKKPLAIGFCMPEPYTLTKVESLRTEI